MDGKNKLIVIVRFFFITTSHARPGLVFEQKTHSRSSLLSLPKNSGGREAMTGNECAVRRLGRAKLA